MRIYGLDFTSRPRRGKPITCAVCTLRDDCLSLDELLLWSDFAGLEEFLRRLGPRIAGIDFPFGQARRFIENIGWPETWDGYVAHAAALGRAGFRSAMKDYRDQQPEKDKEHKRATDRTAGALSPQKIDFVPVGLMFFEGARRLRAAGVTIPGLQVGDPERIVVEAYPGVLARALIGRRSYKQDTKAKQTDAYGIAVEAPPDLAEDPSGDRLDALLCAIQAAWAWTQREKGFGLPDGVDPLEGWIADPHVRAF
jgi:hypothetical protein